MTDIVNITPREQALERENARLLDTINNQAEKLEKLRKAIEMNLLTIEAQKEEIAKLKAQPVQESITLPSDKTVWHIIENCQRENKLTETIPLNQAMHQAIEAVFAAIHVPAAPVQPVQSPKGLFIDMIAAQGPEFVAEMAAIEAQPVQSPPTEPACSDHPDAPHGFNRNASHTAHRYVCDCEGWTP